jgi:hypothetical protein
MGEGLKRVAKLCGGILVSNDKTAIKYDSDGNPTDLFKKYTRRRKTKDGYSISCRRGLWGVHAPTKEQAETEAMRYFIAYFGVGEYSDE